MSDFDVSIGCGDMPTNELSEDDFCKPYKETKEEIQEKLKRGLIKDSCGHWYDPTNYIDCYYADW